MLENIQESMLLLLRIVRRIKKLMKLFILHAITVGISFAIGYLQLNSAETFCTTDISDAGSSRLSNLMSPSAILLPCEHNNDILILGLKGCVHGLLELSKIVPSL